MIREIFKMGDPRPLRVAKPVENPADPVIAGIIADMYETMRAANGVGLAAPQIGAGLRLIFGFRGRPALSGRATGSGSPHRSIPGSRCSARRPRKGGRAASRYSACAVSCRVQARVFPHEYDHLGGVLHPQRIADMTKSGFIHALFPGSDLARAGGRLNRWEGGGLVKPVEIALREPV